MRPSILAFLAALSLGGSVTALAAVPPGIDDLSSRAADGTRTLRQSVVVAAAVPVVWTAFTTTDGYRSWAMPVASVDFRVGGTIEASYVPGATLGDANNIRNEIIAYAPERMFAIRNRNVPADAPFDVATFQSLHTVVLFDDAGGGRTRVTIMQPGYGQGEKFAKLWGFFEWGNGATLAALRDRFVHGPTDWSKPRG